MDPMEQEQMKRKSGLRTMIVVAVLMILEAGVILGAFMVISGPAPVQAADEVLPQINAEDDKIVEVLVLDDRLPNARSGVNFLYDTEIWVHVRKRHEARVSDELNQFRNELKAELMAIWRTAEPRQLQEPKMENLTRKVHALLDRRFGRDPETEEPIIQKTLVVSGPGFRVDS